MPAIKSKSAIGFLRRTSINYLKCGFFICVFRELENEERGMTNVESVMKKMSQLGK